ncbi:MAG: hypothetical protein SH817_08645 [Leptospira sp.]|nr:hypothetical protein [Leptospira sp.]
MKAYQTDNNGYYIGEVDCQKSPLEPGKFLIPRGAFTDEPPEFGENEIPFRVGESWEIRPNFSGKIYFNKETRVPKIFEIGELFDSNFTDSVPIENEPYQKHINGEWVIDEDLKLVSKKEIFHNKLKTKFEQLTMEYRSVVEVENIEWDSGQKYLSNIDTLISVYSKNPNQIGIPFWRDANNDFQTVTIEQLTSIRNEIEKDMFQEGVRLYEIKWIKENEIQNLELADLDSYDISEGWD